ncbi:unnamed protein product [Dibothriocephalus latus]|uniref:Uncharacterized protein n=1 Tax=Dibothriocephalus latus TaxID=60516 RepID=A0A3P6V329_DIBLA|nr:unnamed protein product [Dibothriocephalus latus]
MISIFKERPSHLDLPAAFNVLRHYESKEQDTVKTKSGFADEDGLVTKPPEEGIGFPAFSDVETKQNTNCPQAKPKSTCRAKQRTEKIDQPKANTYSHNLKFAGR